SFAVCQVKIVEDEKKYGYKYDRTNSNSTTIINYYITQEHSIVLETTLEQIIEKIKPYSLGKQNELQAKEKLRNEFENLQYLNITENYQLEQQISTLTGTEMMHNPFFEDIFGAQDQVMPLDE
ncbi:27389_t:CDS:2, partial [Gigaspora margarita]